jgi:hypothetical protein
LLCKIKGVLKFSLQKSLQNFSKKSLLFLG